MSRKNLSVFSTLLFSLFIYSTGYSAPLHHTILEGEDLSQVRRLIEYPDGSRKWAGWKEMMELSHRAHSQGGCAGFMDVTDHQDLRPMFLEPVHLYERLRTLEKPQHGAYIRSLYRKISPRILESLISSLSSFHNRYYTAQSGVDAAHWIRDQFLKVSSFRPDVSVRFFQHRFAQPSVIARIEGHGPLAHETVIIGAHEDSINLRSSRMRAPGADDDASGVATVLETFRILVESGFRPNRSIEFMTYAGEEVGLLGSQDIARAYQKEGRVVAGVLQLGMTMHPSKSRAINLINDHVNRSLTNFLKTLIDEYVKVPWVESPCRYACSDHASWTRAGFPSAFPFEAPIRESNRWIHTEFDTLEKLDAEFGTHFLKLALAFAVELSLIPPLY